MPPAEFLWVEVHRLVGDDLIPKNAEHKRNSNGGICLEECAVHTFHAAPGRGAVLIQERSRHGGHRDPKPCTQRPQPNSASTPHIATCKASAHASTAPIPRFTAHECNPAPRSNSTSIVA